MESIKFYLTDWLKPKVIKNTIYCSFKNYEYFKDQYPRKIVIADAYCSDTSCVFYTKAGNLKIIALVKGSTVKKLDYEFVVVK